mmetsp:Transcript_87897/g.226582  ORF Transcript_87897/g.226582 Transcript_87897/m.226582 type:complete len:216 (+) Transcript_87897:869-1516(+)
MKQVPELASGEARLFEAALRVELRLLRGEVLHGLAERASHAAHAPDAHQRHELLRIKVVGRAAAEAAEVVPGAVHQQGCARVVVQHVLDVEDAVQAVPEVEGLADGVLERLGRLQRVEHLLDAVPGAQNTAALHVAHHLPGRGTQPAQGNVHDGLGLFPPTGLVGVTAHPEQLHSEPAHLLKEVLRAPGAGVCFLHRQALILLRRSIEAGRVLHQ